LSAVSANTHDLRRIASVYADVILEAVRQEYPNHLQHTMTGPDDRPTPRQLHPAFYGCYDWHSCVEMHWALIRLLRLLPDALDQDAARSTLRAHLTEQALHQEATYLLSHRRFERPYGWSWALMLANELDDWEHGEARAWAAAMRPLAQTITDLLLEWLPKVTYPSRDGMHGNSAFGLARSLPWARRLASRGDARLLTAISEAARRWYQNDHNYPASWEPSGADFLSPALAEAELMCETLESASFRSWLEQFLPELGEARPRSLFEPAIVSDETDGQIAHLHGLNLHRAFAWRRLSQALPEGDERVPLLLQAAAVHAAASLRAVTGSDYMLTHWLACYAVLYLGALERS
jgi:Protein of unknown function (DUF2891)